MHQKECRKSLGCALYIRCALSIEKYGIMAKCLCILQKQVIPLSRCTVITLYTDRQYVCSVRYAANLCSVSRTLASHRHSHTGERYFMCVICRRHSTRHDALRHHSYTQTEEWPFQCELYSKGFYNLYYLESHKHIRSEQKPFRCKACNKYFSRTMYLSTHTYIHTGQKRYWCKICNKFLHKVSICLVICPTQLNL
jgi:hypothetical protein